MNHGDISLFSIFVFVQNHDDLHNVQNGDWNDFLFLSVILTFLCRWIRSLPTELPYKRTAFVQCFSPLTSHSLIWVFWSCKPSVSGSKALIIKPCICWQQGGRNKRSRFSHRVLVWSLHPNFAAHEKKISKLSHKTGLVWCLERLKICKLRKLPKPRHCDFTCNPGLRADS